MKKCADSEDTIIYCTDGQNTGEFARHFYHSGGTDSLWFAGIDCSFENRNAEYVYGLNEPLFEIHESFFVNELVRWANSLMRTEHKRNRSGVFGYSCGGAFAASMGIRHPDIFGYIFAFSIAGHPIANFDLPPEHDLNDVSFYFRVGSREPKGMRQYMKRLKRWLRLGNAQIDFEIRSGGHDFALWSEAFSEAAASVFGVGR